MKRTTRPAPYGIAPLLRSLPRFDPKALVGEHLDLWIRLPEDYRLFLLAVNGGFADEFQFTFDTPIPFEDSPSINDDMREFYGFNLDGNRVEAPADLAAVNDTFAAERFIPTNVIGIAVCGSSSLLCLSLREESFGSVWYWDWYWRYPWRGDFYEDRIEAVRQSRGKSEFSEDNELTQDDVDAFNFATMVRLADCFSDWAAMCYDERESEV